MKLDIPYGHELQALTVPDAQLVGIRNPRIMRPAADPEALLRQKIGASMLERGLSDKGGPHAKACIVVTDRTRSTPLRLIVPILLNQLNALGVPDENVTILSGGGMHAADSPQQLMGTLGPAVLERVRAFTNEPDNESLMVSMGTTALGTPVELHRLFAEADIKIGVINVNPCMLAGWSGGGKIVLPGVSSRRTIYANHARFVRTLMSLQCASLLGIMPPDNLIRADLEEVAQMSGIDLIVNTILDNHRQLVDVSCGEVVAAHRAAMDCMAPNVEVTFPEAVDVMVAGVGDPALEVSLFQGGSRVCGGVDRTLRPGGTVVMVNACTEGIYEGFEHEEYRQWMRRNLTPAEIGKYVEDGELGGEKGCVLFTFSWLQHEMGCRIIVVTDGMAAEELRDVHLEHASHVQEAVDRALAAYSREASIGVMPYGGLVLPMLPGTGA